MSDNSALDPVVPTPSWRQPRVAALVAVAALCALMATGILLAPGPIVASSQPIEEHVASVDLLCPVTTATSALSSKVSAAVAPLPGVEAGLATLADITRAGKQTKSLVITKPGVTVTRGIKVKTGPAVLARATGTFVAGFGADQRIRSGAGSTRGLAIAPCTRPITDAWLVGGASTIGRVTTIILVNDDDRAAQVDLLVYGPDGQVIAPAGSGILVSASSRREVRLESLAPAQRVTAIHVVARTGRVSVVALDRAAKGLIPLGMSLLSATTAGQRLVIPWVPSGMVSARLLLISPDSDATVRIHLLTADGPIAPVGLDEVSLTAGKLTSIDLGPALADGSAGLLIESSADIAAGAEFVVGVNKPLVERDATAATPALTTPGLIVGLAKGTLKHMVSIAAPDTGARVNVALYVPGGTSPQWQTTVDIGAGSTISVKVPVSTVAATSTLVVTPLSGGPVHVVYNVVEPGPNGAMLAVAPVLPTRPTALVPAVVSVPGSSLR
ncbi:MAG: DUF5719 family protein [Actinomycetes bacterium]